MRWLNNRLAILNISFAAFPFSLLGLPTLNGKYPNSLIALTLLLTAVVRKVKVQGQLYAFNLFGFFVVSVSMLIIHEIHDNMSILQALFRVFVLMAPLIFLNSYRKFGGKWIVISDVALSAPIIITFVPFFVGLFGLNPFTVNESIVTGVFTQTGEQFGIVNEIYNGLGNSTTIAPALSILIIYYLLKSISSFKSAARITGMSYLLFAALVLYANLWFHQRIFWAVLATVGTIYMAVALLKLKHIQIFYVVMPIAITVTIISVNIDVRTYLWRDAFASVGSSVFLLGYGIEGFKELNLAYSHPHNVVILLLFEYGVLGLASFLYLLISYDRLLVSVASHSEQNNKAQIRSAQFLFLCFCIALSINSSLLAYEYWFTVLATCLPIKYLYDVL